MATINYWIRTGRRRRHCRHSGIAGSGRFRLPGRPGVEQSSAIGGVMSQLDKTFPTNDCSMCIISPKLVEAGRHLNIDCCTP
jgi:hypothetical protein